MTAKKENKCLCCGCRACEQICSTGAISMQLDFEGFLYPKVDQHKCISCGRCEKVCPMRCAQVGKKAETTYLLVDKNEERKKEASSGGAFELICRAFISDSHKYAIWGCALDSDLKAVHKCVNSFDNLNQLKKSKYIQSNLLDAFKQIKQQLTEENIKVIFSGTPCQTAALRLFLQREYDNLLLIDFICHGVPSQKAFDEYVTEFEKSTSQKIESFIFRNKDGAKDSLGVKIVSFSGRAYIEGPEDNAYMFGYLNGFLYRPSCYRCPYASPTRFSDITVADYWGVDTYLKNPEIAYSQGASMLLLNTAKGSTLYHKIQDQDDIYTCEIPISVAIKYNKSISHCTERTQYRDKFYICLQRYPFSKALSRSQYPSFCKRVYSYLERKLKRRNK